MKRTQNGYIIAIDPVSDADRVQDFRKATYKMGHAGRICDIHNHILYGVDDGSKNLEMSLRMLAIARREGIRRIILTPHHCRRYFPVDHARVLEHYRTLQRKAAKAVPDMELYLGSEVYVDDKVFDEMQHQELITMAGSRYLLVEFDVSVPYSYIRNTVTEALQYDYLPILAHVERYRCLTDDWETVGELAELGAYIQVNASSVMGDNGKKAKLFTRKLLSHETVDFIATDAHRDNQRMPLIRECVHDVIKRYGKDYARQIFASNPLCVIEDRCLYEG